MIPDELNPSELPKSRSCFAGLSHPLPRARQSKLRRRMKCIQLQCRLEFGDRAPVLPRLPQKPPQQSVRIGIVWIAFQHLPDCLDCSPAVRFVPIRQRKVVRQ
jgi:hypothetical protein